MGEEIARYKLTEGNNIVDFNNNQIQKGMLLYSLILDGRRAESRTMLKGGN